MDEYKCCKYCSKGVFVPVDGRTICKKYGLVSKDHVCAQFVLDPFKMHVRRARNIDFSKYEAENYSIEEE